MADLPPCTHQSQTAPVTATVILIFTTELAVSYVNSHLNGFGGHLVQLIRCYTDGTSASSTACANQLVDDKVPLVIQGSDTLDVSLADLG
jgi:hypothetical protein